jgi:hypothetical protein
MNVMKGIDTAAMKEWCEVRETVEEMQCCEWCAVRKQESNAVSGIRCDVTKRAGVISASLGRHRRECPASHWTKCIAGVILEGCMAGETLVE